MRNLSFRQWLILAVVLCLLPVASVYAEGNKTYKFELHGTDPVIAHHTWPAWDGTYTDPGAVVVHDGKFYMFRNGFKAWPASVQIGYAVSDDGLTWTEPSADPVLMSADVPFAGVAALASSAVVLEDGTWVLYFYTWTTKASTTSPGVIGRATAAHPEGPWKVDAAPVLVPGNKGTWDSRQVSAPRVVQTATGFVMYYAGTSGDLRTTSRIGLATSTDGITWVKYNDPATTDALYAESDPIMTPDTDHLPALKMVHQPAVVQTPDGWVMIYRYVDTTIVGNQMVLSVATSVDGIHWTYDSRDRLWTSLQMPTKKSFWYTALAYNTGTYYLYIEGENGSYTDIYVATFAGQIKP
ncbi:MAG: hypothetical protein KF716_24855 [Anaerolineae bacterium]|nr:hypothetical protein [Anaerolineae bacterium]